MQSSSLLSAFAINPLGTHFETQEADEKITLLLRSHPITNLPWLLLTILGIILPLFLSFIGLAAFAVIPIRFQIVSLLVWYMMVFAFAYQSFLTWYFNVYIVTPERVIDVDFFSLLYKQISDAPISKIQDVTYKMGGPVQALFDFGHVFIQTAGHIPQFEFINVPKPDRVAKIIAELMQKEEREFEHR